MDDELDDDLPDDAALAAALDAAEMAQRLSTATATGSSSSNAPIQKHAPATGSSSSNAPVQQPVPQKLSRGISSVIVNTRQKGNPILSYIKNVPWEYGDIIPDYVLGASTCALFLSLKYHRLHPEYIYTRMRALGTHYTLRVLLVLTDIDAPEAPLQELAKTCLINNFTLILSWSGAEAGRYLEAYKALERAAPTGIMENRSADYQARVVEVLTQVRSLNKVDAVSLVGNFGSVRRAVNADPDEIALIPGWGPKKVERWEKAVAESFRRGKKEGAPPPPRREQGEDKDAEEEISAIQQGPHGDDDNDLGDDDGVLAALAKLREKAG